MTIKELIDKKLFETLCVGDNTDTEISKPFCCDLLSVAMGKTPDNSAWVTVMANVNTLAVATLTDCACVIFAEGIVPDRNVVEKAKEQGITLMRTELPVFEASLEIYKQL